MTEPRVRELLAGAGIDMDRLNRDLDDQCQGDRRHPRPQPRSGEAFGFHGTPSFIVGKFRVPGVLTMAEFEMVITDARKAKKTN